MKAKKLLAALFISLWAFSITAQERAQGARDIVLVVDSSAAMGPYYNQVGAYLSGPFLAENLRVNDTLHLISFGAKARLEIVRRVVEQGDIETIAGRIWLLYPMEPVSDPGAALGYAEQYVKSVPGGRTKKIFLITSGDAEAQTKASASRMPAGADLSFIRIPVQIAPGGSRPAPRPGVRTAETAPSRPAASSSAGRASEGGGRSTQGTGSPGSGQNAPASGPGAPSTVGGTNAPKETAGSAGSAAASPGAGTGLSNTGEGTRETAVPGDLSPANLDPDASSEAETGAAPPEALSGPPEESVPAPDPEVPGPEAAPLPAGDNLPVRERGPFFASLPLPVLIGGGAVLLLALGLLILLMARNLHSSPNRVMASANAISGGSSADGAALLNSFANRRTETGLSAGSVRRYHSGRDTNQHLAHPPMLNLFVEDQNTAIGRRNVHTLKAGNTYSVGGGNSDFLIFLVPMPPRIGQLYYDGKTCTFTPLRARCFPDIGSSAIYECIGKTIRVISDRNYEIFFHFEQFKDPLIMLNQLLDSIKLPENPPSEETR
jgi:hypothetical protein